ncbi:hypothetical protein [Neomoorella mulderi]|uniref:Polysaccharide deacetylase n=1 Tax=Moorella mulderi DSM 14980 TaxID=1122241 RepID=A0A151AUF4_9FIRM|nr:hypothetical protein [Moorella mulderi]KYH31268.1 hypothetical protein MOMUL_25060 [Moorella mulderi DSM 14980]
MVKIKFRHYFLGLIAFLILLIVASTGWLQPTQATHQVRAGLLITTPGADQGTLAAYGAVLKEEGFPWAEVGPGDLNLSPRELVARYPALILPEGLNQVLPSPVPRVLTDYVHSGGKVLLVYDPGTRGAGGERLPEPALAGLAGVNYGPAPGGDQQTYDSGYWQFSTPQVAASWGITPGKLDRDNAVSSYGYGRLRYRHVRARLLDARLIAFDSQAGLNPVITEKSYPSGGSVVFVNIPLGYYKQMSDDLALRSIVRTFLIKYAHLPRLVNTPRGKGGLVVNFHLDSNAHIGPLRAMIQRGIFRPDLHYSIHITAGPDTYRPGDGYGFDAASPFKGRPWVELMQRYGAIGSHGGWIHNYFAANLEKLPRQEVWRYLALNCDTLAGITGQPVLEYSAPVGNHPAFVNEWLQQHGVLAYYSPGDTGSSPTRSIFYGRQVSGSLWSFPITPYQKYAALEELMAAGVPLEEVKSWFDDLLNFIEEEHAIRLIYTHASKKEYALAALAYLANRAARDQEEGRLLVWPMSRFASFLNRHEQAQATFNRGPAGWVIKLKNKAGLADLTVAVHTGSHRYRVTGRYLTWWQEGEWLYITTTDGIVENEIYLRRLK